MRCTRAGTGAGALATGPVVALAVAGVWIFGARRVNNRAATAAPAAVAGSIGGASAVVSQLASGK